MSKKCTTMQESKPLKTSGWLQSLLGPAIVGLIVLSGQGLIAPMVARGVKIEESVLEQRYMACDDAFNALLRNLEHASIVKEGEIKYEPIPTKEKLTAIEINSIYCRLALFGSSSSVPKSFAQLILAENTTIKEIGEFVLKLRKEMGIKGEGVAATDFYFAYPTKEAVPK